MSFTNELWADGFPEREATVRSGTLTDDDWHEIVPVSPSAQFVELITNGILWTHYDRDIPPPNTASAYRVFMNTPIRLEKPARFPMLVRRGSGGSVIWSTRVWTRA